MIKEVGKTFKVYTNEDRTTTKFLALRLTFAAASSHEELK